MCVHVQVCIYIIYLTVCTILCHLQQKTLPYGCYISTDFDYKAQLEHLLCHQWHLVTDKARLHHHDSSSSQPLQERLSHALQSLAEQGKTSEEAVDVMKSAICSVLGDKWEKETKTLLEGLECKVHTHTHTLSLSLSLSL